MTRGEKLSTWLKGRAEQAGANGFVFGLSGGIDSAVVARLCQLATPGHVLGVIMPCYSQTQDEQDARLVAEAFDIPVVRVDLSRAFDALGATLDDALKEQQPKLAVNVVDIKQRLPRANIKPRMRMTSLYYIANAMNYVVAGTGNRSEITLGYYTKYGDGGVDVLPIGQYAYSLINFNQVGPDGHSPHPVFGTAAARRGCSATSPSPIRRCAAKPMPKPSRSPTISAIWRSTASCIWSVTTTRPMRKPKRWKTPSAQSWRGSEFRIPMRARIG